MRLVGIRLKGLLPMTSEKSWTPRTRTSMGPASAQIWASSKIDPQVSDRAFIQAAHVAKLGP